MSQTSLFPELVRQVVLDASAPAGASDEWYTPRWVLDLVPAAALDPCWCEASNVQALAQLDLRRGQDGLAEHWGDHLVGLDLKGRVVWVNPPYSDCAAWMAKCAAEGERLPIPVVAFVPAKSGEAYWFRTVWGRAVWVVLLRGRVAFDTVAGRAKSPGSFTSAFVCWGRPELAQAVLATLQERARRAGVELWALSGTEQLKAKLPHERPSPFLPRGSHVPDAHPSSHVQVRCRECGQVVTWQTAAGPCPARGQ